MTGKYDDIMDLPHPTSPRHPRMSLTDRAAQFSPFSALVGYEDAIAESGRLTCAEQITEENEKELLDRKLRYLHDHPGERIFLTYFQPDERKTGGAYLQTETRIVRVDPMKQLLITEELCIPMGYIRDLQIPENDI